MKRSNGKLALSKTTMRRLQPKELGAVHGGTYADQILSNSLDLLLAPAPGSIDGCYVLGIARPDDSNGTDPFAYYGYYWY